MVLLVVHNAPVVSFATLFFWGFNAKHNFPMAFAQHADSIIPVSSVLRHLEMSPLGCDLEFWAILGLVASCYLLCCGLFERSNGIPHHDRQDFKTPERVFSNQTADSGNIMGDMM